MTKEISDKALQDRIDCLPKEISPERDLWAGIEKATHNKKQIAANDNKFFTPSTWAASIVVAVLVTWLGFSSQQGGLSTPQLVQKNPESGDTVSSVEKQGTELVGFMEDSFNQQKQAMLVSFGQPNLAQLPEAMQTQLSQLASARKSIKQALVNDENNVDLLNLLDFTQQQELKLIQQLYRPQLQSI
ncbi:hypothetical protein [Litorilituus lipolyticus]|uniref:Uncharacterized protein n=1 Tax=Litorilituus lipolyticus TaxID=2491017 RepID=A0A502L176_9GAMM|nr:hypothetical protein [Litorilituus lipolyticus]TPH17730.1 hypothetical protein EPA86_04045 [Litorilituus lipolyticus]